ncbi:pentapeptide repeat-containing protein [Nocardiopsis coralliicola]
MPSPAPRQWTAIALAAVALPLLTATAWPLGAFLAGRLPEGFPLVRALLGLACAVLLAAAAVLAWPQPGGKPVRLGWLIIGGWAVAIATVAGIVLAIWFVLGSPGVATVAQLSPRALDAMATRAFAIVAGLGGVALLVIAYRRQRALESEGRRAALALDRENTRLFTERFTTASEQLGSEHPAVRLAGVHALAHLADDAPSDELVQMVINVLCAYLRMPFTPAPDPLPEGSTAGEQAAEYRERALRFGALREVRHTIIRAIGHRLREQTRWCGKDYDFTGVVFDGGDLHGAVFSGGLADFSDARFAEGTAAFDGARFSGGTALFHGAQFDGGTTSFTGSEFSAGTVAFTGARFTSGLTSFDEAVFTGGSVLFTGAKFTGGEVSFRDSAFTGSSVSFTGALFSSGWVTFRQADISGGRLDFSTTSGEAPDRLLEAMEQGWPGVVALPRRWQPTPG